MKNFKFSLLQQGIHIQGEAQDLNGNDYPISLLLSYEEEDLPWDEAIGWAKEQGGALPTRAQYVAIQEHRDEINVELEKAGKEKLGGWYWTCEEYQQNNSFAWCVNMNYGDPYYSNKGYTNDVRAVSAFPIE